MYIYFAYCILPVAYCPLPTAVEGVWQLAGPCAAQPQRVGLEQFMRHGHKMLWFSLFFSSRDGFLSSVFDMMVLLKIGDQIFGIDGRKVSFQLKYALKLYM